MKILHITNWYPTNNSPTSAIWIYRHIQSLNTHTQHQKIWHIDVQNGKWKVSTQNNVYDNNSIIVSIPINIWLLKELVSTIIILWVILVKERETKYDIINIHIAYPLLTFIKYWKILFKTPLVITEHWSAYHFNFGVKNKPKRIQNIFKNKIPVITVSKALNKDISTFSDIKIPLNVIPNVVDISIFRYKSKTTEYPYLFMLGFWKEPKDPIIIIEAYEKTRICNDFYFQLIIGGYGVLEIEILKHIEKSSFKNDIKYLGKLNSIEVAFHMNEALAFIHISVYETFSVVCAEAICCGTPVLASKVGGIPEFINESNGYLIKDNNVSQISKAINNMIVNQNKFDRKRISIAASLKFSTENIGILYNKTLQKFANN